MSPTKEKTKNSSSSSSDNIEELSVASSSICYRGDESAADLNASSHTVQEPSTDKQRRVICCVKSSVILALICAAIVTSYFTYVFNIERQNEDFQDDFQHLAVQFLDDMEHTLDSMQHSIRSLSMTATSFTSTSAINTLLTNTNQSNASTNTATNNNNAQEQQYWPFIQFPTFQAWGGQMWKYENDITSLDLGMIVTPNQRTAWNFYTSSQQQWVNTSLQLGAELLNEAEAESDMIPYIWKYNAQLEKEEDRGPTLYYTPIWQSLHVIDLANTINRNEIQTNECFRQAWESRVWQNQIGAFSATCPATSSAPTTESTTSPYGLLIEPIFESVFQATSNRIVGFFQAKIVWKRLFQKQLTKQLPINIVLEGGSGDDEDNARFIYETEKNGSVELVDNDHDLAFTEESVSRSLLNNTVTITVHATDEFYDSYSELWEAWVYAGVALGTILLAAVMFIVYDCFVQKDRRKAAKSAARSNKLLNSLFPANVRDRVLDTNKERSRELSNNRGLLDSKIAKSYRKNDKSNAASGRKKLSFDTLPGNGGADTSGPTDIESNGTLDSNIHSIYQPYKSKPIADMFPNTTVLFSDIVGFTAWSSQREPTQVFTLLETLYNCFDRIARRRKVFKVETIGDCYVAVTGLPKPMEDHAVTMAKFARECLIKMVDITRGLELQLGPDTGDLTMRFGLHSGPVTAGVLRGEKSRFQLFGDTVNTAARMESTGASGKIHVSKECADLIVVSGKSNWVRQRENKVLAKGKGRLQTYWLEFGTGSAVTKHSDDATQFSGDDIETTQSTTSAGVHSIIAKFDRAGKFNKMNDRKRRLVDYNIEILSQLLRRIMATRETGFPREISREFRTVEVDLKSASLLDSGSIDTIQFPKEAVQYKMELSEVTLSNEAASELRDYVSTIACKYNDEANAFHCFEHAAHVTMSVNKLLARTVAVESIDYDSMMYKKKNTSIHDNTFGIASDPLTHFALVFSALIHDVGHPGAPTGQFVSLAINNDGKSGIGQSSFSIAWTLLMGKGYENLRQCIYSNRAELERFRQIVANSIIATDVHDKKLAAKREKRWQKAFRPKPPKKGKKGKHLTQQTQPNNDLKATVVIEMLMQASVVSHTMQHWHVFCKWDKRLYIEMYEAHKGGLSEIDPSKGWYEAELAFFDSVVIPLANKLKECNILGVGADESLNYALANRRDWEHKGQRCVREYEVDTTRKCFKLPASVQSMNSSTDSFPFQLSSKKSFDSSFSSFG